MELRARIVFDLPAFRVDGFIDRNPKRLEIGESAGKFFQMREQ